MEKILVIGSPGSGKSTMSVALSKIIGYPVVHLDKLFWRENWQHISRDEFDVLLMQELEKDRWIIEGEYSRTLALRLKYCDTVICLDYPRWQCLHGVLKRVATSYGKVRPDMGEGCKERFDWKFLQYVWNYKRDQRDKMLQRVKQAPNVNIIILKNRKEGKAFLTQMANEKAF